MKVNTRLQKKLEEIIKNEEKKNPNTNRDKTETVNRRTRKRNKTPDKQTKQSEIRTNSQRN